MAPLSRRALLAAGLAAAGAVGLDACAGRPPTPAPAAGPAASPATRPPLATTETTTRTTTQATGGPARAVFAGPRGGDAVALTFHGSGEVALVARLLELLDRAGVRVSLFAVGAWLEANPAMAGRWLAGGHELDNHTATHPVLGRLGAGAVAAEIEGCRRTLTRLTGGGGRYFRPSGMTVPTPLVLREAGRAGYPVVAAFDVDPRDYADPGPDAVAARVAARLRPGSIVSLHTGHAGTVAALPRILAACAAKGLRPVPLHDLLA
jgi:peptidoglycan/xylan/chitin deacetylase (PgdA/CDA1 family)